MKQRIEGRDGCMDRINRSLPPGGGSPQASPALDVRNRMERLLAKAGVGIALLGAQTTESIDQRIREFRGHS